MFNLDLKETFGRIMKSSWQIMRRKLSTKDHEEAWKRFEWLLSIKAQVAMFLFLVQNILQAAYFDANQ